MGLSMPRNPIQENQGSSVGGKLQVCQMAFEKLFPGNETVVDLSDRRRVLVPNARTAFKAE